MRKLTLVFALILCLVLVFAFASCGKKTTTSTTAAPGTEPSSTTATPTGTDGAQPTEPAATTAPEATEPEATTAAPTQPVHQHVAEAEYTIELEPTCSTVGRKCLYCEECGEVIPDSIVEIPIDPDAHNIPEWIVDSYPTLLNQTPGSKHGTCLICEQNIVKEIPFEPIVCDSLSYNGEYKIGDQLVIRKKIGEIRDGKSLAPTPDDPDGNDIWFEYSFLYNDSLYYRDRAKDLAEIRLFAFWDYSTSNYRGFYYLYLRDNNDGFKTSTDCPWKGHIDYSTYDTTINPPENCADDLSSLGNTLNGRLIGRYKAGWDPKRSESPYLWDSEWQTMNGWHRLGYRYHQEAKIEDGKVVYSGYTELYIDGVLCWRIQSNFHPTHKDSLVVKQVLPWTAAIDPEDPTKLVYTHNDDLSVEMRVDNFNQSSQNVYFVYDDPQWTAGDGFATPVMRVDHPVATPITLAEGVEDCGAMYFTSVHDHVFDGPYAVTKEATLLESGTRCKTCSICGNYGAEEAYEFEPEVHAWTNASSGTYNADKVPMSEVMDGDHFYPTTDNPAGKDLLVEYSILWNESMLNFVGSSKPHITTRIGEEGGGKSNNLVYWSPVSDNSDADCKFAGGFEYGTMRTSEEGNPYPKMTKPNVGDSYADFPNIGGTDQANPEWGWHRVQIRVHEEVTNLEEVKTGAAAAYKCTTTIYIDGVLVSILSSTDMMGDNTNDNKFFTAASDGKGGVTYTDIPDGRWLHPMRFNSITAKADTTIYMVYADLSVTCGTAFVQNVEKVASPVAATLTVAEGVTVPATMYYQAKADN